MKSQLSKLWESVINELDTTRYFTKSEINELFKDFKRDLHENYGKDNINFLEQERANRDCSVVVNGNSKVFDFTGESTESIDKLIEDIRKYAQYPSEEHRLNERAKQCATFDDMLAFLREELIGKKCREFSDIRWDINRLLGKINKHIYVMHNIYSRKEFLVFLDCGKDKLYWANGRSRINYENPCLFTLEVSRQVVATHPSWSGNRTDYAIKTITSKNISNGETLKSVYDKWKAKEDAKNNAEELQATAFLEGLKAHGFESIEDFKAFCYTATVKQKKQFS